MNTFERDASRSRDYHLRRTGFVKNLSQDDTILEAADREGKPRQQAVGGQKHGMRVVSVNSCRNSGVAGPGIDAQQQEELVERLREDQLWKPQEIQHHLQEEFGVGNHPNYLGESLPGVRNVHEASMRSILMDLNSGSPR